MEGKICCTCREKKRIENFSKNKRSKDGYKEYCKQCAKEATKKYREKYRDEINARNKKWYDKTKQEKEKRTQEAIKKGYRICTQCHNKKDILNFYKRGNGGFYGECKQCHNDKVQAYKKDNREIVLQRKKDYYQRTREYQLTYFKEYNQKNSERNTLRAKIWRKNNRDKYREHMVMSNQRRTARESKVENNFTRKQWSFCKDFFRDEEGLIECAYCNKKMKKATQDHFIPLYNGGGYTADNIIPVCQRCNSRKSAADFYEWYPRTEFYSSENVDKIEFYLNLIRAKQANTVPSLDGKPQEGVTTR